MNRNDLTVYSTEEIKEAKEVNYSDYILKDDVMSFIDEIEARVNGFKNTLDSIRSIGELDMIDSVRSDIKTLCNELY